MGGEAAVSDVCLRQQAREGAQEHISLLSLLLIILSFLSLLSSDNIFNVPVRLILSLFKISVLSKLILFML